MVADVSAPLDRHLLPAQLGVAIMMLGARLDAAIHAERGHRRRIARLPDQSRHVIGLRLDELHVAHRRADILRGDVAAAERLHMTAVRAEDRLAVADLVVADDDGLSTSQIQPRHRRLVRHAAREPQAVDQRFPIGRIVPEPRTAECGAECRVVNRDDAAVAGGGLVHERHLLVLVLLEQREQRRRFFFLSAGT